MYSLIIAEKPSVSRRIAESLSDGPVSQGNSNGVSYSVIEHEGKEYYVVSAVGHLFSLKQKSQGWTYPVFDIEWVPIYETSKTSDFAKKYLQAIRELAKEADSFYISTDYDIEGELIGHNILNYACPEGSIKKAKRMKFSTLTKGELVESFAKAGGPDFQLAEAGETRHRIDWIYGINISRALTHALRKASGNFITLSSGRVQGPALKILADRERQIKKFVPEDYWTLELKFEKEGEYSAWHHKESFREKGEAEAILKKCRGKPCHVKEASKKQFKQSPPVPFDLTTLQTEAYRLFKYKPKYTQKLAQTLYEQALISYPRTSSQKLPSSIGYEGILGKLAEIPAYKILTEKLLSKTLKANQGKADDPAHPAIYPTGEKPTSLEKPEHNLYDLIVKRFFAVFGKPAIRETVTASLEIEDEIFIAKGTRTIEPNWHLYYAPYVHLKEEKMPGLENGEQVKVLDLLMHEKQTQPPSRYTAASIVRELEKQGLGTKATRADIVATLESRQYVNGASIEVTLLGMNVIETLEKHCPRIINAEMTRKIEAEMGQIQEGKLTQGKVLSEAEQNLTKILDKFKEDETKIGKELTQSYISMKQNQKVIGTCPKCGGEVKIIRAKVSKKRFCGCSNYPKCDFSMPLPQAGAIRTTKKKCHICDYPIITLLKKGNRPWHLCINIDCPSKKKKAEPKPGPKPAPEAESKTEPETEPKTEPKIEPKAAPKPESKAEPKAAPKPGPTG